MACCNCSPDHFQVILVSAVSFKLAFVDTWFVAFGCLLSLQAPPIKAGGQKPVPLSFLSVHVFVFLCECRAHRAACCAGSSILGWTTRVACCKTPTPVHRWSKTWSTTAIGCSALTARCTWPEPPSTLDCPRVRPALRKSEEGERQRLLATSYHLIRYARAWLLTLILSMTAPLLHSCTRSAQVHLLRKLHALKQQLNNFFP